MKIEMPKPKAGGLLISYSCNAKCKHCYLACGGRKDGKMSLEDARRNLLSFREEEIPKEEVHITGGEPFLDINYLIDILNVAHQAGYSGFGFVETNAFWATDQQKCERVLETIKRLGVEKLCISADIFHQEFVPISKVRRLVENSYRILGANSVMLRWPKGLELAKHIGEMSDEEIKEYILNPNREFRTRIVGRGATDLVNFLPKKPAEDFRDSPCFEKIVGTGHYHFDLHNDLIPGIGCVILGNSSNQTLREIIDGVSEENNPIFASLSREGPAGDLLNQAKARGYKELEQGYCDKCHLCFDIKKHLKRKGHQTNEVGPNEAYL